MKLLQIIGIGLWERHLTNEAIAQLKNPNASIILQTERCYISAWLKREQIPFETLDAFYDCAEDFDQLYTMVCDHLMDKLQGNNIVLVFPGSVMDASVVPILLDRCKEKEIQCQATEGVSLAQTMEVEAMVRMGWPGDARVSSIIDLQERLESANEAWCITEIDQGYWATKAKLALMEYYPDDWSVLWGIAKEDAVEFQCVSLFEIDQLPVECYSHRSCLLIQAVPFDQLVHYGLNDLALILRRLRAPNGCPWDRVQTSESLRNTLIEESYELREAIEKQDDTKMIEELGDVLMLVYFHLLIAEEQERFTQEEVCTAICEKLIYRHSHVFATEKKQSIAENQRQWDELKRKEKGNQSYAEAVNDVAKTFPALLRAQKILKRMADAGCDQKATIWNQIQNVIATWSMEEIDEEKIAFLLLSVVDVAREKKISAEDTLYEYANTMAKQFAEIEEEIVRDGKQMDTLNREEWKEYWRKKKDNC